jgi:hypothetical protein
LGVDASLPYNRVRQADRRFHQLNLVGGGGRHQIDQVQHSAFGVPGGVAVDEEGAVGPRLGVLRRRLMRWYVGVDVVARYRRVVHPAPISVLAVWIGADERPSITDRELVERLVDRIIITSQMIEIRLRQEEAGASKSAIPAVLKVRWKGPEVPNAKGILHSPLAGPPMIAGNRDVVLTAIAKARAWIADLAEGRAASFAEIANREGKVERHIRLLAPLAFVSPQFVSGIVDGHVPSVAVTALAKHVSWSWAQQRTDV